MKDSPELLQKIFETATIKTVLDLGSGRGRESLRCANRGALVHAVDLLLQPPFSPEDAFYEHPNITFFQEDIIYFLRRAVHQTVYDLIIMYAVLPFFPKNFFQEYIMPFAESSLSHKGSITFSYYLPDDPTFMAQTTLLRKEDFMFLEKSGYSTVLRQEERIDDNHPPVGLHKHHRGHAIVKKTF